MTLQSQADFTKRASPPVHITPITSLTNGDSHEWQAKLCPEAIETMSYHHSPEDLIQIIREQIANLLEKSIACAEMQQEIRQQATKDIMDQLIQLQTLSNTGMAAYITAMHNCTSEIIERANEAYYHTPAPTNTVRFWFALWLK